MKMSPCNEESCAEGMHSACVEQVLRDVSAHHAPHPSRLKRRAMTGFFKCTIFSESIALNGVNIPTNLTEWLTTIERKETAKQGQSR